MQAYMSVIAITGALAAGAVSPGPSFIVIQKPPPMEVVNGQSGLCP